MSANNPFGMFVRWLQRTNTALSDRRLFHGQKPIADESWRQNFQPFSEKSGMPNEHFAGEKRLVLFQLAMVLVFVLLGGRLVELKVVRGEEFRQQAATNYTRFHQIRPPRGIITDRHGVPLVKNEPSYVLLLTPRLANSIEVREEIALYLSEILPDSREEIRSLLDTAAGRNQVEVALRLNLEREQALQILTDKQFEALKVETHAHRHYLAGDRLSHILGYLTEVYEEEITSDASRYYRPGDKIGRDGIERSYEDVLRGIKGTGEVEVDAQGRSIQVRIDPSNEPRPGHNLTLTIDLGLQEKVTEVLANGVEQYGAESGVAVVLDVNSGEILSMASVPTYDNNLFSRQLSTEDFARLYAPDQGNPMFNRAIAGTYPPASTFKVFVAAAALQEGTLQPNTRLNNPGFLSVGGSLFRDWIYLMNGGSFGVLDTVGAIARSSDVFFYQVGAGYEGQPALGSNRIKHYAELFGMGQLTGIDLPGEIRGMIPSETTYAAEGKRWYWGNTAHMAIGQGFTLVTPLQLAVSTAAVANGGTVYRPHLVKEVAETEYAEGFVIAPEVINTGFVDARHIELVQRGMRTVVTGPGGTATILNNLPVTAAGKTGTAQHDLRKRNHAWFVAYAPYENPEIAVVVLFAEGGEGSQTAAPATRDIMDWYFTNRSQ